MGDAHSESGGAHEASPYMKTLFRGLGHSNNDESQSRFSIMAMWMNVLSSGTQTVDLKHVGELVILSDKREVLGRVYSEIFIHKENVICQKLSIQP